LLLRSSVWWLLKRTVSDLAPYLTRARRSEPLLVGPLSRAYTRRVIDEHWCGPYRHMCLYPSLARGLVTRQDWLNAVRGPHVAPAPTGRVRMGRACRCIQTISWSYGCSIYPLARSAPSVEEDVAVLYVAGKTRRLSSICPG
jgi:hypothetical protein